jgi:hypothetical protein
MSVWRRQIMHDPNSLLRGQLASAKDLREQLMEERKSLAEQSDILSQMHSSPTSETDTPIPSKGSDSPSVGQSHSWTSGFQTCFSKKWRPWTIGFIVFIIAFVLFGILAPSIVCHSIPLTKNEEYEEQTLSFWKLTVASLIFGVLGTTIVFFIQ